MCINIAFKDYVSSENIYIVLWYYVVNDYKVPSTSSQTAIQEVFLPRVSKLNDSAINKEHEDQTHFSPNKHSRKKKMDLRCYYLPYSPVITPID